MPLQNGSLDSLAKATFLYQKEEKPNFPNSNAVLLISIGQIVHEGAKLSAVINLINKNFKSCDIAVCDVLQRHSMQIMDLCPVDDIYKKSYAEGKNWLDRNFASLQQLKIPSDIFSWEKYLLRPDFSTCQENVIVAYNTDLSFKQAMDQTIEGFIRRYERRLVSFDRARAFNCCFNYLIEETAIIMLMWQECGYKHIIYPGNMPKVLAAARDKFVVPENPSLLKWVTVYIRNRMRKIL